MSKRKQIEISIHASEGIDSMHQASAKFDVPSGVTKAQADDLALAMARVMSELWPEAVVSASVLVVETERRVLSGGDVPFK